MKGATRLAQYYLRSSVGESLRTPVVYYTRGPSLDSSIHGRIVMRAQAVAAVDAIVFAIGAVVVTIGCVSNWSSDGSKENQEYDS